MGAPKIERALAALEVAGREVAELSAEIEARDTIIAMSAVPALIADLVYITKRPPQWHLGHLSAETFALVRERLGGAPVSLHVHDDGARFLVIEENRGGLIIQAQTTAPAAEEVVSEQVGTQP